MVARLLTTHLNSTKQKYIKMDKVVRRVQESGRFVVALETIATMPSSFLYSQIVPYLKEEYPSGFKFLFLNSSPVNNNVLQHIVETVDLCDIPYEFVMVITNQESVKQFFDSKGIKAIFGKVPAEFPIGDHTPIFNNHDKLCPYPWAGIHVEPQGYVKPCCDFHGTYLKHNGTLLNASRDTFEQMINSSDMKLIREQFKQGISPEGCKKNCLEAPKGKSTRFTHAKHKLKNIYGEINWEGDGQIKFLNGHFSNLCNLGCVICEPLASSILAVEELKNSTYSNVKQDPKYKQLQINLNTLNENSIVWRELDKHLSSIRNFEILGGEPLLNKNILRLIERLIESGHSKNCVFQITSNGTQFPDICNQLHNFKQVFFHFSIDNTGSRFEYERYLSKWEEVLENLNKFNALAKQHNHIKLHFAIAVSILNAYYLPELLEHLSQYKYETHYFGDVNKPSALSLNNLTPQAKDVLITKLTKFIDKFPKLDFVLNLVKNCNLVDGKDFCEFISNKDSLRNLNLVDTHKEICDLMGYTTFINQGETKWPLVG